MCGLVLPNAPLLFPNLKDVLAQTIAKASAMSIHIMGKCNDVENYLGTCSFTIIVFSPNIHEHSRTYSVLCVLMESL
jgi:hypothetical protein